MTKLTSRSSHSVKAVLSCGLAVLILTLIVISACADHSELPELDPTLRAELESWLTTEGRAPNEYVVGLFDDHDVVFLGEWHRIKHDLLFVRSLFKPLYDAGIRVFATEFARREDQPLIDTLLAKPNWDEALARRIVFQQFVHWGYQEYVDLLKAAWEVNQGLPEGAPRFQVIGMNDSPDWSYVKTQEDRDRAEIKRKVWQGGGEEFWAEVILDTVDAGERVLVHCGIHHAFTQFRQPIVNRDGEFVRFDTSLRAGNHVYNAIGKRAITIFMHAPWPPASGYYSRYSVPPADGLIDALMLGRPEGPVAVGFDIVGSPLADIEIKDAVYRHGYERFTAATFCDGWIYTQPYGQCEGVTAIEGWIHDGNLEHARQQSPNPRFRTASAEDFNGSIAHDAEMERRFKHLPN